jgi:hypothetical protein
MEFQLTWEKFMKTIILVSMMILAQAALAGENLADSSNSKCSDARKPVQEKVIKDNVDESSDNTSANKN